MLDTDHTRRLLWQKQRRAELARAVEQGAVALLPTGAIEQHGPHLPLDTDIWSALAVSLGAAAAAISTRRGYRSGGSRRMRPTTSAGVSPAAAANGPASSTCAKLLPVIRERLVAPTAGPRMAAAR